MGITGNDFLCCLPRERKLHLAFLDRAQSIFTDEDCDPAHAAQCYFKFVKPQLAHRQIGAVEKTRNLTQRKGLPDLKYGLPIPAVVAEE
jgi:hypothetical protein